MKTTHTHAARVVVFVIVSAVVAACVDPVVGVIGAVCNSDSDCADDLICRRFNDERRCVPIVDEGEGEGEEGEGEGEEGEGEEGEGDACVEATIDIDVGSVVAVAENRDDRTVLVATSPIDGARTDVNARLFDVATGTIGESVLVGQRTQAIVTVLAAAWDPTRRKFGVVWAEFDDVGNDPVFRLRELSPAGAVAGAALTLPLGLSRTTNLFENAVLLPRAGGWALLYSQRALGDGGGFGADGIFVDVVDNNSAGVPTRLKDEALLDEPIVVDSDGTVLAGYSVGQFAQNRVDVARFDPVSLGFDDDVAQFALDSFKVTQFALPSSSGLAVVWGEDADRSSLTICRAGVCPIGTVLPTNFNSTVPQAFARIGPDRWAALTEDSAGAIARFVIDAAALDLVPDSYAQIDTRSVNATANAWRAALGVVDGALVTVRTTGPDAVNASLVMTLQSTCDPNIAPP